MSQSANNNEVIFYSTFFYFPFKIKDSAILEDVMRLKVKDFGEWKEVPFDLWQDKEDIKTAEGYRKSLNNQELLYFHHYLSRIAYNPKGKGKKDKFLKYYRISMNDIEKKFDDGTFSIVIDGSNKGFYLSDLAMYIFKDGQIGILSIGVKNNGCALKDAMEFNMNFRHLYITDNEQLHDGKGRIFKEVQINNTPLKNEFSDDKHFVIGTDYLPENINSIVDSLVLFKYLEEYEPLLDHRMVLHTLFCLDKNWKGYYKYSDRYRQLFSRILFVDNFGNGYAYDECFMKDVLKKHIYTRWEHYSTLYGFCRYADVTMEFYDPEFELIRNNFENVYYMMSIIALYYRCALIDFAACSSEVTRELIKPFMWINPIRLRKNKPAKELRKAFLKFSNVWYFRELTNQDQGIEMFDMHRRAYELDELHQHVKEEIEKLDEHIRMEQARKLNRWIVILTIVAALVGFFGMNFEFDWFKNLIGKP